MSLFPSAFDTPGAGSSRPMSFGVSAGKKKKGKASLNDDKLRDTAINVQKLMAQVERGEINEKSTAGSDPLGGFGGGAGGGKKKKRRGSSASHDEPPAGNKKQKKKAKSTLAALTGAMGDEEEGGAQREPAPKLAEAPKGKKGKNRAKSNKEKEEHKPVVQKVQPKAKGTEGLTKMQQQMANKLEGARFRWINEQLYTTPSTQAVEMMKKEPKIFEDYHNAHRVLTAAWPSPPLPHIIELLNPLPQRSVIADLGCGDAGLAKELVPKGKVVLSYDLVGDGEWVTSADFLTHVPLPGRKGGLTATVAEDDAPVKSKKDKKGKGVKRDPDAAEIVDAVVCCLSLMGTNWLGGIYEAARILKQGGTLHIAEVTSRFTNVGAFVTAVESFGFRCESREEPSTHFMLFRFTKIASVPQGPARDEPGWDERIKKGESILEACVYKKR